MKTEKERDDPVTDVGMKKDDSGTGCDDDGNRGDDGSGGVYMDDILGFDGSDMYGGQHTGWSGRGYF